VVVLKTEFDRPPKVKGDVAAYGAPIEVLPGAWTAYIWLDASRDQVRTARLRYSLDGGATFKEQVREEYPYEFNIPVGDAKEVGFEISGRDWECNEFRTVGWQTIQPAM